eukprot:tig00000227_g19861.t1
MRSCRTTRVVRRNLWRILLAMLQGFQYPRIPLLAQRGPLAHYDEDECADSDARALADGIRAYLTNMPHGLGGIQRHLEAARAAEELENCPGNFPLGLIFTDEAIPLRRQFETMLRSLYADLNVAIRLARPIDWRRTTPCSPTGTLTATAAVDKEAESLLVRTPYQPIYEGAVRATWAACGSSRPQPSSAARDDPAEARHPPPPSAPAPAQAAAQTAAADGAAAGAPRRNAGQAVGRGGRGQGHQRAAGTAVATAEATVTVAATAAVARRNPHNPLSTRTTRSG